MKKMRLGLLSAVLMMAGAAMAHPVGQEAQPPSARSSLQAEASQLGVAGAGQGFAQQVDRAGQTDAAAALNSGPDTARATDVQDAPLLVEGLPLWSSPDAVSAWLMSKPGIVSTRMNPPDEKGRASMQVRVDDPTQQPRIAGVKGQLWPIFIDDRLRGLRVLFMRETDRLAIFCSLDGRGVAQRLNAYLTERFGEEKTGGFYARDGLRARLIYRTFDRRSEISDTCEASGQGVGYAMLELYLVADGDSGFVGGPPETIYVNRNPVDSVRPDLRQNPL